MLRAVLVSSGLHIAALGIAGLALWSPHALKEPEVPVVSVGMITEEALVALQAASDAQTDILTEIEEPQDIANLSELNLDLSLQNSEPDLAPIEPVAPDDRQNRAAEALPVLDLAPKPEPLPDPTPLPQPETPKKEVAKLVATDLSDAPELSDTDTIVRDKSVKVSVPIPLRKPAWIAKLPAVSSTAKVAKVDKLAVAEVPKEPVKALKADGKQAQEPKPLAPKTAKPQLAAPIPPAPVPLAKPQTIADRALPKPVTPAPVTPEPAKPAPQKPEPQKSAPKPQVQPKKPMSIADLSLPEFDKPAIEKPAIKKPAQSQPSKPNSPEPEAEDLEKEAEADLNAVLGSFLQKPKQAPGTSSQTGQTATLGAANGQRGSAVSQGAVQRGVDNSALQRRLFALKRQIQGNWTFPSGLNPSGIRFEVLIEVDELGRLLGVRAANPAMLTDPVMVLWYETAERAIIRSDPLLLPPEILAGRQQIKLTMEPS